MTKPTPPTPSQPQAATPEAQPEVPQAPPEASLPPEVQIEQLKQEVAALEELIQARQPAEAGFSVNFTMQDKDGASTSLTFRGAMASDWPTVFKERGAFVKMAQAHGWKLVCPEKAPEIKPVADVRKESGPAAAQNVKQALADAAASQPIPADGQFMTIAKVEIKQGKQPDRADILLYQAGHNYPDLKVQNWPHDKAAAMLSQVMDVSGFTAPIPHSNPPAVVVIPHKYDLACIAVWKEGQAFTNSKTGATDHYKDVVEIRPTA